MDRGVDYDWLIINRHEDVLKFIAMIRMAVATKIQCYMFYLVLKSLYSNAIAYCNSEHIITKIGDYYYDIDGEISPQEVTKKGYLNLEEDYGKKFSVSYFNARTSYNKCRIEQAIREDRYNYREPQVLFTGNSKEEDIQLSSQKALIEEGCLRDL